jgi:hypothetical protein
MIGNKMKDTLSKSGSKKNLKSTWKSPTFA